MRKIHKDTLSEIECRGLEIVREELGEPAKTTAGNLLYNSPFREDNDPSFHVQTDFKDGRGPGWSKDFVTDESFSVVDIVMKLRALTFKDAVQKICQQHNIEYRQQDSGSPARTRKKSNEVMSPHKKEEALASDYGLSWKDFEQQGCKMNHTDKRVEYPYKKHDGATIWKYRTTGRVIDGNGEYGKRKPWAGPGGFIGCLFGDGLKKCDGQPLVICGGEEKQMAATKAGFCSVSLPNGEKPPNEHHVEMIKAARPAVVIIDFDADNAGKRNSPKAARVLHEAGLKVKGATWDCVAGKVSETTLDKGFDTNDLLKQFGIEGIQERYESAVEYREPETASSDEVISLNAEEMLDVVNGGQAESGALFDRFCARDFRYLPIGRNGQWLHWNSKYFEHDPQGLIASREVQRMVEELRIIDPDEAGLDEDERKAWRKHLKALNSARGVKDCLEIAKTRSVRTDPAEIDKDSYLLNTESGVVNLKTGELLPHDPKYLITKITPLKYNPNARCPQFLKLMNWAMSEDEELVRYVQKLTGYCLTADISERSVFIFHGTGSNGKSVVLKIIEYVMGDYCGRTQQGFFTSSRRSDPAAATTHLNTVIGNRLSIDSESAPDGALAASMMKMLTGESRVSIRLNFNEAEVQDVKTKFILQTNHFPRLPDDDQATLDRLVVIPFLNRVNDEDRKPDLADNIIREESEGILSWMIEGCKLWQEEGLNKPKAIDQATKDYEEEQDVVQRFISEECVSSPGDRNINMGLTPLYSHFETFCHANKVVVMSRNQFSNILEKKGFPKLKGGSRNVIGLSHNSDGSYRDYHEPGIIETLDYDGEGGGKTVEF